MDYKNIKSYDDHVIIEEVKNFKLKHIFECGQVFRFEEIAEGNYHYSSVWKGNRT